MRTVIPATMKAIRQQQTNGQLVVEEIPVPQPKSGEVLVKMAFSPINPSDLSFLQGTFHGTPNYPIVPGLEGSGVVVAAGSGFLPKLRLGKQVSCSAPDHANGTWAEYMVTPVTRCIPVAKGLSMEQGASGIVNPMTALGFIDTVKSGGHKAFVNNAAASSLGRMVMRLAKLHQLPLINVVRREEQVRLLKSLGAEYVLCSADANFRELLRSLAASLHATIFFDAIGGEQTSVFAEASPKGSTIVLYSNLSEEPFTLSPREVLQDDKLIKGFSLGSYTSGKSLLQMLAMTQQIGKLATSALTTTVQKTFDMEQANEALQFYRENMTAGKVLFRLNP